MHDVDAVGAVLSRQTLSEHPHAGPPRTVCRIARIGPQSTQRPGEDDGSPLLHWLPGLVARGMLPHHPLGALLGEHHRAGDIRAETLAEALRGLLLEGGLVAVLDVPDGDLELQACKVLVLFDRREGLA